ncbi:MAG: winged helix-turn-helix transcriptional regulator [Erysipelotrichaceae bacterium]|nr:winged helix-turn-helix transcriptional regulator [Erysipelotrichaceae bacterium]
MTNKEKEILDIILSDPTVEQSEIARRLNISRSTVAVHISSLLRQGLLLGKGYILPKEDYVVGIGACNVDVYGKSRIPIRTRYDHPADISSSVGGVMRNIICNYTRLGGDGRLITAYGSDSYGKTILEDCQRNGIDLKDSLYVEGASSGIFMQIQDENNDMYLAICDMSVLEHLTPEYILRHEKTLLNARLVVIDPSLREDTIEEIIRICQDRVPLYIDPISDNYALKMKKYVGNFTLVKPNLHELENLSGKKIASAKDQEEACGILLRQGAKKVIVSLGKDGILYMDGTQKIRKKFREEKHMVNASGAGDALMAALIYGEVNGLDTEETIGYGLAAGVAAIRSSSTINENMSVRLLKEIIKENEK